MEPDTGMGMGMEVHMEMDMAVEAALVMDLETGVAMETDLAVEAVLVMDSEMEVGMEMDLVVGMVLAMEEVMGNSFGGDFNNNDFGVGGGGNEGWERPVKTVIKHVYKNIAVPHPVPAPVQVPVPKYIKYFKPFAIAKPVAIPHVIPVVKHVHKSVPFFASFPVRHSVPVPKFVGLPVQVRVPRPVFVHVPKIVPVAKKIPVPVEVNVPRPYLVPVYKTVPVPVPHKVPKIIEVIKEVPHFVKKPVPVYIDSHQGNDFTSGTSYSTSSYSNHYGNDEDLYGGPQGVLNPQDNNAFDEFGYNNKEQSDFNQGHGYSGSQNTNAYDSPYFYGRQKLQGNAQSFGQKQYPPESYPRAHRLSTKANNNNHQNGGSYQQQGYRQSSSSGSSLSSSGLSGASSGTSGSSSYPPNNDDPSYNGDVASQGQASVNKEQFYKNVKSVHQSAYTGSNNLAPQSNYNLAPQYSQPVYNPSAYAEYLMSQEQSGQKSELIKQNYSQPQAANIKDQNTQNMMAQASGPASVYHQYSQNSYRDSQSQYPNSMPSQNMKSNSEVKYASNYNRYNKQPNSNYHRQKFPPRSNNYYRGPNTHNPRENSQRQNENRHQGQQMRHHTYADRNPNYRNYNHPNYQAQQSQRNTQHESNSNMNGYVPSGTSSTSTSHSYTESKPQYQVSTSGDNAFMQNEKFDHAASQNTYVSDSNIAVPGPYVSSDTSYSHSRSSSFGNQYSSSNGNYAPQASNQILSQSGSLNSFHDNNLSHMSSVSSNSASASQSNSYTQPVSSYTSYSNAYSKSNSQTNPGDEPLQQSQSASSATYRDQNSMDYSNSFNNQYSSAPGSSISESYSSYSQQSNSGTSFSPQYDGPVLQADELPSPFQNDKQSYQTSLEQGSLTNALFHMQNSSQLVSSGDLPKSPIDEMEQHVQSSASSIIKVYTNSPDSAEGKNGKTFSFVDPETLESSQSATYFHSQEPDSRPKIEYSSEDLKIYQGSSFNSGELSEPLQTSLDAYVPAQPVYQPASHQNMVYEGAMSDSDAVYKEAISLSDTSNDNKSR
ncbi:probable cyclin-dependent serine/threonine-protein kinase DDB_G0292550 [Uloborus diversus]|uniref:probable cyclin-dependent serine/threonine-protein kinase DDB_G0292550 n=1 Tax=Uloborus diversus TaxID=327109 RepID=UPI00240A7289|nr:probable cyclin-dependent serine/threonine-protein kinase DDB_G0292550 [Uloborus diversus]